MQRLEFDNGLKLIHSIDAHELGSPEWYPQFRDRPVDFFLRCADQDAELIWQAMVKRHVNGEASAISRLKDRIDTRLNNCLCEMKEGYDDSIVGFNEAWDIVRKVFAEELARTDSK